MTEAKTLYGFMPDATDEVRQYCLETALKWKEPPETVVQKFSEGKYGNIYSLTRPKNYSPRFRVVKFPHFREFSSLRELKEVFELAFHELEMNQKLLINPWVHKFDDLVIVFNWPFFF